MKSAASHYNQAYFDWYKSVGAFGGVANQIKFIEFIHGGQKVLDFGCGGGYLLSSIDGIDRYGVEINDTARAEAEARGLTCCKTAEQLPDNTFDLIVSDNALEHTENPLQEIRHLRRSLKDGGLICMVVPLDNKSYKYFPGDINYHLFSWSPMNLGNLLDCAGFQVISSKPFVHKWVPRYNKFVKLFGWEAFHVASRIWGRIETSWCQTRAVAVK